MNDALRKCSQYLNDCVSIPKANLEKGLISELVLNSSDVKKDSLFFAVQGELSHGKSYIDHAIALGAIAIVLDSRDRDTIEAKNKPLIFIDGLKEKIPVIASKFYKAKQREAARLMEEKRKAVFMKYLGSRVGSSFLSDFYSGRF